LSALADHLGAMEGSNGEVSVSGFCWGGSRTFWFATERPDLKAAYVFYGTAPEHAEALGRIGARVYGFYGGDDARVNATIDRTKAQMEAAGKTYEPVAYPGAGHGFLSRGEGDEASAANREAAERAWQRWLELLG
jgi:carboxymethylenebutenolidase